MVLQIIFWILLFIILYTFLGYSVILYFLNKCKKLFFPKSIRKYQSDFEPEVCLFVTAFNEKEFIEQKVKNSFALNYPKDKIQYLWVTDGSNDGTPDILRKIPEMEVHHFPDRKGKMHAMNRGMKFVKTPFVIFSDTNTILGENSIREIVAKFSNENTGCVAGEKRIIEKETESAAGAGEGMYWKFESWIKKNDSEFNTAVGAVGELFAIRTELFDEVETDTLLDDFIISLRIAQKGFHIAYTPNAYAEETASLNVKEEMKRKVRIAAGGIQTIFRLKSLLNPFKYGVLSWQYFSHKVLRWTLAPLALFLLFFVNLLLFVSLTPFFNTNFYAVFFHLQLMAYFLALVGWYFENRKIRFKLLFIPYYFVIINYTSIRGMFRFLKGKQTVNWEKAKRAKTN